MFIARKEELKRIKRRLNLDSLEMILVYGRRRIGKTELINEAIKESNKKCLSLLARRVTSFRNLEEFSLDASVFMDNPLFNPRDFYEFFASMIEYSKKNPFILFIDEYCYLKNNGDDIDSMLQKAIELHGKGAKLTIIICGSYIESMRNIVEINSPLYGRFNEVILLHSFNYLDSSKFYPTLSNEDKFKYYAIFGGTAFNLKNIDYSISFEENLINEFIRQESFFEKEAINIIKGEIEKEENVNTLFELIANGVKKYKELNNNLGDPSKDNVGRYLKKLENMDLIDKSFMVNAKSERKPLYKIKDNLLDFYFTFLYKYSRIRNSMDPKVFFENYVKEKLYKEYLPHKFEEVVKEYVILENGKSLPLFNDVGRYYYNDSNINYEFDVVLGTSSGLIPIECKYSDNVIDIDTIKEEEKAWNKVPLKIDKLGFASKKGFSEKVLNNKNLILITLDDLYKISD